MHRLESRIDNMASGRLIFSGVKNAIVHRLNYLNFIGAIVKILMENSYAGYIKNIIAVFKKSYANFHSFTWEFIAVVFNFEICLKFVDSH